MASFSARRISVLWRSSIISSPKMLAHQKNVVTSLGTSSPTIRAPLQSVGPLIPPAVRSSTEAPRPTSDTAIISGHRTRRDIPRSLACSKTR